MTAKDKLIHLFETKEGFFQRWLKRKQEEFNPHYCFRRAKQKINVGPVEPRPNWFKRTHCKKGHSYSEENTGYFYDSKKALARRCLACDRIRKRKRMLNDSGRQILT